MGGANLLLAAAFLVMGGMVGLGPGLAFATSSSGPVDSTAIIRVQHLGEEPLQADPGSVVTAAFRIENRGDTAHVVHPTTDAPPEWSLAASPSAVEVAPGGAEMWLLSLSVPPGAPVQRDPVQLHAEAASVPSAGDSALVHVQVRAVRSLRISVLEAPTRTISGQTYGVRVAVTNAGNVPTRVCLDAESARSSRLRLDSSAVSLSPTETSELHGTVEAAHVSRDVKDHLTFRAHPNPRSPTSLKCGPSDSTATARRSVAIIPASGTVDARRYRFPASVRLQTTGNAQGQGGQIELRGEGDLFGDESHQIEFFIRGPEQSRATTFGRQEVYRSTYRTDAWTVRAGDQIYSTTPLVAPRRRGMGGEVRHQGADWTVGAYAHTSRRGLFGSQVATYARYAPHTRASLTASVLHKRGYAEGTAAAIEGSLRPWKNASVTVEGGLGQSPRGLGSGLRAELSGSHDWGNYRLQHLVADGAFPSVRRGERRSHMQARLRLTDRAYLFGNAHLQRRSSFSSIVAATYRDVRLGGFMRGTLGANRWSIRLSGADDRTPFRDRQFARLRGRLQTELLSLHTTLEAGQSALREGAFAPYHSLRGQLSLRLSGQQVNGFVKHTRSGNAGSSGSQLSVGLSSRVQIGSRTHLSVEAEWRNLTAGRLPPRRRASLDLQHELPFGHTVSASGRFVDGALFRGPREPEFRVSYDVPFDLPLGRDADQEVITGRVVDAETGVGVSEVLVHLGQERQVTDENGRFSFPSPQTGTAYLRVDRSTLDRDRVPMLDLPMTVSPSEDGSDIVVPLQERASLTVQVNEYGYSDLRAKLREAAPDSLGGLERLIVEAVDDVGRERRLTGVRGQASFQALRPGTWTIRLVDPQLPKKKVIEQNTYEVTLKSGEQAQLEIRVLPKRRNIEVQEGGSLKLDDGSG